MAVMVSAGILGQWPIGRLADKLGRLLVLRVQVFVVILGSIAMLNQAAMAPALFMLGAAGFTLYPVAMARLRKSGTSSTGCHEPGIVIKLYRGEPAGAVIYRDADAELLR